MVKILKFSKKLFMKSHSRTLLAIVYGFVSTGDYPTQSILADRTAKTDFLSSILNYTTAGNKSKESAPPSPVRPAKGDLYSPTKSSTKV